MSLALIFLGLAVVIVIAAMFLAKFADGLADQTGLGRTVTGLILLAGATSLPEFSIGFNAVRMNAVDLTAGDVLGSSLINLLILAVLDLFNRTPGRLFSRLASGHALSGIVACLMTGIVLLGILLDSSFTFLRLGPCSWALILTYLICSRLLYLDQRASAAVAPPDIVASPHSNGLSMTANLAGFMACGAVIFFIAPKLAHTADELAMQTGLGRTFFGTVFVAMMTSLPEAISTLSAMRLKANDMAIGNILGSNAFNMLILGLTDFASDKPVLSLVSSVHAITAACVIITTCATILCLLYRAEKRWWIIEPDAALVILLILGSLYLVYLNR
jgi:cation:H+ antiporter